MFTTLKPMSAIEIIKHYESLHDGDLKAVGLQPKVCPAGFITAGWGRVIRDSKGRMLEDNLRDWATANKVAGTITEAIAEAWLREDISEVQAAILREVKVTLQPHQIAALVSFVYNVGIGNFRTSTMLKLINAGNFKDVFPQFMRWVNSGGKKLNGLICRRKTEAEMWSSGTLVLYGVVNGQIKEIKRVSA